MADTINHNPDILTCLANLSNDEVFTPPELANQVLDLIPQDFWSNPNVKVLDPACKSGVLLRECAKRFIKGLEPVMPDLQKRIDHVFQKQLFGYAITELTAQMSRRSVYCSKTANGKYSITHFGEDCGNIDYKRMEHTWKDGKCIFCGAPKKLYGKGKDCESYAYRFIHINEKEFKELQDMKFDLIISNPPYQLNVGVAKDNYAVPIYQNFVEQAKKLNPRFLCMIIPARWYAGGRGLDEFRDEMLHDNRLLEIHDFTDATDCFPGVDIAGGVCYFLWKRDSKGDCLVSSHKGDLIVSSVKRPLLEKGCNTFIRQNEAISILHKVQAFKEKSFMSLVSPQTPFGLISSFRDFKEEPFEGGIKFYTYGYQGYISSNQVVRNNQWIEKPKIYISAAYGERGNYPYFFLGKPFIGEPNSCCSQSYLMIGPFENKSECENVISYIITRFFRALIMLKKNTQHAMSGVYQLVPLQDFSKPWTDDELYKKYGLTEDEIAFIESMIKPMDFGDSNE